MLVSYFRMNILISYIKIDLFNSLWLFSDFKNNVTVPSINMVDVYPLLAHLLDVEPLPNNGTLANVIPALKHFTAGSSNTVHSLLLFYATLFISLVVFHWTDMCNYSFNIWLNNFIIN